MRQWVARSVPCRIKPLFAESGLGPIAVVRCKARLGDVIRCVSVPSVSVCRLSAGKVEGHKDTPFAQRLVQVVGRYGIVLRIDDISAVLVDKSPHGAGLHGRLVVYEGIGIGKLSFYGDVAVTVDVCPFSSV